MKCKKCNTENDSRNIFCIQCGAELDRNSAVGKLCPSCGYKNEREAAFCTNCGDSFSNKKSSLKKQTTGKRSPKHLRKQQKKLNLSTIIGEHKLITAVAAAFILFMVYQSIPLQRKVKV